MWTIGDKAQSFVEYLICLFFILGGISVLFADPVTGSDIQTILSGRVFIYTYFVWFLTVGTLLLTAKIRRKKKLHKHMLMATYLSTIFITILEYVLLGWGWHLADNVLIGIVAAWFWIRWKLRTEYLDMRRIRRLRRDLDA